MIPTRLNWPVSGGVVANVIFSRNSVSLVILKRDFAGSVRSFKIVNNTIRVTKRNFLYWSNPFPKGSWRLPSPDEALAVFNTIHLVDPVNHILGYKYFGKWLTNTYHPGPTEKHREYLKFYSSLRHFSYEHTRFADVFLVKTVSLTSKL